MQGWYIGITAASQAVKAGSTPVPCSKKKNHPLGGFSFWSSTFAPQKWSPAGGRLNASGGTRQRFPPHTPPSLRCAGVRQQNLWAVTKRNTIRIGWCFLFGMPRAGWNSLPRPARSASNRSVGDGVPDVPSARRCRAGNGFPRRFAPRSKCPWGTPRNDRGEVYRHAERSHPCWDGSFLYLHITPRWSGAGARRAAPWAHSARGWSRRGRPGA